MSVIGGFKQQVGQTSARDSPGLLGPSRQELIGWPHKFPASLTLL